MLVQQRGEFQAFFPGFQRGPPNAPVPEWSMSV
jgi:hypothetical protein